ncbi:hypothetical protein F5Y19DRAFT_54054 [Xylariaceae sp. FL1651]|nr:hypothetical protein F5Y19DRAFT_54054 [Xylariaceae sp. FL1651]
MASANSETLEPKPRSAHKIRKRAPKACLSCRARKVRCDVFQRGRPCMNCYLDSETCVVTGRASRFRKAQRESNEDAQASHPPYSANDCGYEMTAEDSVRSRINGNHDSPQAGRINGSRAGENSQALHHPDFATNPELDIPSEKRSLYLGLNGQPKPAFNRPPSPSRIFDYASPIPLQNFDPSVSSDIPLWVGDHRVTANADITYSYYPFLSVSNFHNILPQDVNYLESQGCLRVPTRAILDEFVQQYFLHVHPLLPLINEGDFWEMYCHQGSEGPTEKISLLVFQAILFSCCNFVPKSSIKALGFPTIRAARATFYRRTKLLYDFDTEASLVCLAQTALLLSYWAPNWSHATKKPNTAWLSIAIQNAKSAEAHLYSAMPTFSQVADPVEYKKQNILKRLWWCCVIRDRILPLGMRRSIQVSRAHFDLDSNSGLGYIDLADEVERSKVYNAETKRCLIEIFVQIGELCSVLTDILTLVFPLDDTPGWGRHNGSGGAGRVRECKIALRRWYKGATLRFPMFGGGSVPRKSATENSKQFQHDSVILYTNLMYMYYHSARAALCHYEVLQLAVASASPNLSSNLREFSNIYENRHELQDAACGVTECLKELIQLGLARWLPISAMACTALPLVLHIIDVKLSSHNKGNEATTDNKSQTELKQHRLNILIEAMKTYQPQYDGADYISETIRHIINLAQLDPPSNNTTSTSAPSQESINGIQPTISDWTDILSSQPGSYIRLAMTMDISLSKGRLAEEADFPIGLRGLFTAGFSPIRTLIARGRHSGNSQPAPAFAAAASQTPAAFFAANPMAHIQLGTVHSMSSDEESGSPSSVEGTINSAAGARYSNRQFQATGPLPVLQLDGVQAHSLGSAAGQGVSTHMFDEGGAMGLDMDHALTADALAAYVLHADTDHDYHVDNHSARSDDHSMYDGDGDAGQEEDWIERAWGDEGRGEGGAGDAGVLTLGADGGDRETARVLLDALRDGVVGCAA